MSRPATKPRGRHASDTAPADALYRLLSELAEDALLASDDDVLEEVREVEEDEPVFAAQALRQKLQGWMDEARVSRFWKAILERLSTRVGKDAFEEWIAPLELGDSVSDRLRLLVPDQLFKEHVASTYRHLFEEVMAEELEARSLRGRTLSVPRTVEFVVSPEPMLGRGSRGSCASPIDEDGYWPSVLKRLSRRVGGRAFRDWFEPTKLHSMDDEAVLVEVPNVLFKEWLERNYQEIVDDVVVEEDDQRRIRNRRDRGVRFIVTGASSTAAPAPPERLAASAPASAPAPAPKQNVERAVSPAALDPRYSFQDFVVGSCNQFAHAAARAVADAPGVTYNPLYLYGGVGLGKTHLMQAIGLALESTQPAVRISCVSAERFMCEMIDAIRWKRQPEFREKYRGVDALLVDDIQFLEGKEATQEEFFHTFRTLYEEGKQVVLTSDCPPRELATLEERLRSRFESGLIADLQVPDLETKLAILRRRCQTAGTMLSDEVALHLAECVRSNVRELEGCLTRLLALASLRRCEPNLELARESTRELVRSENRPVSVEAIQRFVAGYYNVRVSDLKARNSSRSVAFPRQVAMYLCKKMTDSSFPDIGRRFGGKHHSTVIHSIGKIRAEAERSEEFEHLLQRFMDSIP